MVLHPLGPPRSARGLPNQKSPTNERTSKARLAFLRAPPTIGIWGGGVLCFLHVFLSFSLFSLFFVWLYTPWAPPEVPGACQTRKVQRTKELVKPDWLFLTPRQSTEESTEDSTEEKLIRVVARYCKRARA